MSVLVTLPTNMAAMTSHENTPYTDMLVKTCNYQMYKLEVTAASEVLRAVVTSNEVIVLRYCT